MEKSRDGRSWSQAVRFWSFSNVWKRSCNGFSDVDIGSHKLEIQPNGEAGLASGNGVLSRNEDGELADILR
nr:hypothetical protein Iba_chr12aCG14120 [Ipomoea batatas]